MEKAIIFLQVVKVAPEAGWTIDPGWVIAGLMAIVGTLLVMILNRLVKRQDEQGVVQVDQGKTIVNHDVRLKVVEEKIDK